MATESAILSVMLALPVVGGGAVLALPAKHARKSSPAAIHVIVPVDHHRAPDDFLYVFLPVHLLIRRSKRSCWRLG